MSTSTEPRITAETIDFLQRAGVQPARLLAMSKAAASETTIECGACGGTTKVSPGWTQATRTEPMRFLGYSGYCSTCQVSSRRATS